MFSRYFSRLAAARRYRPERGFAIVSLWKTNTGSSRRVFERGRSLSNADRDLVARAVRGEAQAFAGLVREHSGLVYRVALRMLGDPQAQDASQEVWVRAWRNINNFRGDSAFSTWLYKITMNTCLNIREKELRRERWELRDEIPYLPEMNGSFENHPESTTLSRERKDELLAALQRLRAEHRAAVVLRHLEELTYREISEILEVPEGTAKAWTSRGRAALLVLLAGESDDENGDGR